MSSLYPLRGWDFLQKDLPDPGLHAAWKASWNVFKTACLMLNVCSIASLEAYSRQLMVQWLRCWRLIYTADDAGRAERLEKLQRRFTIESGQGRQVRRDWDPLWPWSCIFIQLAADMEYCVGKGASFSSWMDNGWRAWCSNGGIEGSGPGHDSRGPQSASSRT